MHAQRAGLPQEACATPDRPRPVHARRAQLQLFLVDPRGTDMFRIAPEAPQLGLYSELNEVMLIGESRRPLRSTFAGMTLSGPN
jgi:hypothetical protein